MSSGLSLKRFVRSCSRGRRSFHLNITDCTVSCLVHQGARCLWYILGNVPFHIKTTGLSEPMPGTVNRHSELVLWRYWLAWLMVVCGAEWVGTEERLAPILRLWAGGASRRLLCAG